MPARVDLITAYSLTVDFFQCNIQPATRSSIEGPPPVDLVALTYGESQASYHAGGFTVQRVRSTNAAYHVRLNILTPEGLLLAYLLTDPTKTYGPLQHFRPLHVNNEAFYALRVGRWLLAFFRAYRLELANVTRLDVALDTQQCEPARLINSYTNQLTCYQHVKHKNQKNETWGVRFGETTYYGHGSKQVQLSLYNKTAELAKKPKNYVTAWHQKNGFGRTPYREGKPVYRVEVSIKARALKDYRRFAVTEDGEELSVYKASNTPWLATTKQTRITTYHVELASLDSPASLATLFARFFPVDIRKKDATRATNCTPVQLFDFGIYGTEDLNTTVATRPTANTLSMEKNALRLLVTNFHKTGNNLFLETAQETARLARLTELLAKLLVKHGHLLLPETAPGEDSKAAA